MLCRRLLINFSKTKILENAANMQNVSEFEKSSIRKNWQQDLANGLSRGSLSKYNPTRSLKEGRSYGLLLFRYLICREESLANILVGFLLDVFYHKIDLQHHLVPE